MKKSILIAIAFIGCFAMTSVAQKTRTGKDGQKEVKMEEVNGEKVLTVTTYKNGQPMQIRYSGEAAEKKLAEIEAEEKMAETVELKVEEIDGKKKLTVIRTKAGERTQEVYEGEEAEAKLKELEGANAPKEEYKIKSEKKVIEKANM